MSIGRVLLMTAAASSVQPSAHNLPHARIPMTPGERFTSLERVFELIGWKIAEGEAQLRAEVVEKRRDLARVPFAERRLELLDVIGQTAPAAAHWVPPFTHNCHAAGSLPGTTPRVPSIKQTQRLPACVAPSLNA